MPVPCKCVHNVAYQSLACGVFFLLAVSTVDASPTVNFNINVSGGTGGPYNAGFTQNGAPTINPGVFSYRQDGPGIPAPYNTNGLYSPFGEWAISTWDFTADGDPSGTGGSTGAKISTGFVVTNNMPDNPNSAMNHLQFSIMITMPVQPSGGATSFFGSGGFTLNVTPSLNNNWGFLTALNGPILNYMVNGADSASLFPQGYFLGASGGPSTLSDSRNLTPAQTGPLAGVHPTSMGIRLDFDLTPGETVSFNGVFGFIPGPGALALLGMAGLIGRSRRRN